MQGRHREYLPTMDTRRPWTTCEAGPMCPLDNPFTVQGRNSFNFFPDNDPQRSQVHKK
uniref:Uncharacterized protein n=1 Tax=Rhizophora mucronata TaxID=61149 RepID=A0A2P2NQI0_RHIMU